MPKTASPLRVSLRESLIKPVWLTWSSRICNQCSRDLHSDESSMPCNCGSWVKCSGTVEQALAAQSWLTGSAVYFHLAASSAWGFQPLAPWLHFCSSTPTPLQLSTWHHDQVCLSVGACIPPWPSIANGLGTVILRLSKAYTLHSASEQGMQPPSLLQDGNSMALRWVD